MVSRHAISHSYQLGNLHGWVCTCGREYRSVDEPTAYRALGRHLAEVRQGHLIEIAVRS